MSIYKEIEFKEFLRLIEEGEQEYWYEIAKALDVDQDTITKWKKTPEAGEAIRKGIVNSLKEMKKAGIKDWRMWESRLKMLGVNPPVKAEIKHGLEDPVLQILNKFGVHNDREADTAKTDTP